jgi:hypothetical protein
MPARTSRNSTHKPGCGCFACQRPQKALTLAIGEPAGVGSVREAPERSDALDADVAPGDVLEVVGRTARDRIAQWIQLRHLEPGITNIEVAKRLGITAGSLNAVIGKARREGWLRMTDPLERIEHEIIPQTLDNIAFYLSKEGGRDKQITLETAKATIYKQFTESKGISEAPQTVLALKIETAPAGADAPAPIVAGTIVGKARVLQLPESKPQAPRLGPTDQEIL